MDDNQIMNEVEEAVSEVDTSSMTTEDLKTAVKDTLDRVRNQAMIAGYRVACTTIMQMIAPWHDPKASKREYERIFKRVEEFFGKALKQDDNGTQNVTDASTEE